MPLFAETEIAFFSVIAPQGQLRKSGDSEGWFQTAANWGNFHEVNYRDKTLIGVMIERLRRPGGIRQLHYSDLPFNIL